MRCRLSGNRGSTDVERGAGLVFEGEREMLGLLEQDQLFVEAGKGLD
jgi:hypothetical protein